MIDKLKKIKNRFDELSALIASPEVISDMKNYQKLVKEYNGLEPICVLLNDYEQIKKNLTDAQLLKNNESDSEMKSLAEMEIEECEIRLKKIEEEVKVLLLPKDENDDKNVIMEIRAGAGGDEASLFSAQLFRMYAMFAEKKRMKVELLSANETELGGMKEISFRVQGKGAYASLKFESGVHRVQRVPETESSGRIHTSTSTVAVLPEHEEVDIELNEKDLKIDTYRSSGAGGQHVNTTDSAIRITHLPTNIVVACQDGRSQLKNKEQAMKILKSKLYDHYRLQKDAEYAKNRRDQVGTGDRSERIRTYNFPQGRLTDHRINYTVYNLDDFMNGNLDDLIENLKIAEQKYKLENAGI